jgi:hypothetical protein
MERVRMTELKSQFRKESGSGIQLLEAALLTEVELRTVVINNVIYYGLSYTLN